MLWGFSIGALNGILKGSFEGSIRDLEGLGFTTGTLVLRIGFLKRVPFNGVYKDYYKGYYKGLEWRGLNTCFGAHYPILAIR